VSSVCGGCTVDIGGTGAVGVRACFLGSCCRGAVSQMLVFGGRRELLEVASITFFVDRIQLLDLVPGVSWFQIVKFESLTR